MAHISGSDRAQMLLLPEAIDDYVGEDNPVRFVDAFVDGLDLAVAGFERVSPSVRGRPGYDPADLLKLYIYGYLNRVRSSRRLEVEAHRNIEVIWLMRRLTPDFKTIADFRRENRSAFRQVFREFTLLCRELDLFGRELIAVDGTRIKAVNNKDRNFTRTSLQRFIASADARLEDYLQRLENGDAAEAALPGGQTVESLSQKIEAIRAKRDRQKALLDELERTGESQISLTDPDSRAMAGHTKVAVGYNIQCAVDTKYKLIVDQQVTNDVVDMGLLLQAAEPALDILGVEKIDVVADSGYFRAEDIEECEAKGLIPHIPRPRRGSSIGNGRFGREMFRYDPERDVYHCPGGAELHPNRRGKQRDMVRIGYTNAAACKVCALRERCTTSFERRIHRLENVRGEFSLTALAYNIRRAITLIGVPGLIAALQA